MEPKKKHALAGKYITESAAWKRLCIVTGGQTGVDRAALDVALALDLPVRGWCPKNRLAEDGRIPERYPLQESASEDPALRTELNAFDSDGTLVTPYHLKATVVRSHKGDWKVSERLAFLHYMDAPAPKPPEAPALCEPRLIRVFTKEHTSSEIELSTGEFRNYDKDDAEARVLECLYPTGRRR